MWRCALDKGATRAMPSLRSVSRWLLLVFCCLQKFGMTDIASFGVSFESNDLHLPAVAAAPKDAAAASKASKSKSKKGKKGAAVEEEAVEPLASSKSGHVLKNLLPAGALVPAYHLWSRISWDDKQAVCQFICAVLLPANLVWLPAARQHEACS
jgi:hypothetical protein